MDDYRGNINCEAETKGYKMIKAGIYIHIPFCKTKCIYCDFYSMEKREEDMPHFVDMLVREIELTAYDYKEDWMFDTIFFGGGTPSLMKPQWLQQILKVLDHSFDISNVKEITLEANPGEATRQTLSEFRNLGINRLSMGFQSLQPKLLTSLSRIHSPKDCFSTYQNARDSGFDNINVDILFNIPGQSLKVFQDDLKQVIQLEPEHISAYSLTVEKNTPLYTKVQYGEIRMLSEDLSLDMFELCRTYLRSNGYSQYEISNYSKKGIECRHNLHYWNLEPYLAFGPSAHGFDCHRRWWNTSSLDVYMQMLAHNERPVRGSETLNQTDHFNEAVINGLRTRDGIQLRKIHTWRTDAENINPIILKWKDQLDFTEDFIRLKTNSYKYADVIALDMIQTKVK